MVLISVGLGIICVLLLVFIILQYITITAERDLIKSYKNTVEEFNQTIREKESQVKSLSEELKKETSNRGQYTCFCLFVFVFYNSFIKYMFLCGSGWFFVSTELKSWSDSRQYCRDHGSDLIIINTEEKQVSLCECLLMNERNLTYSCFYSLRDSYLH